jgi:translation initiation factor IF-2
VIHKGVGTINEGDILLASASNAVIIGFNVRPEPKVAAMAQREQVDMRFYGIIYQVTEDIKKAMTGLLAPTFKEEVQGRAEVRQLFQISKVGTIAGAGCSTEDHPQPRCGHPRRHRPTPEDLPPARFGDGAEVAAVSSAGSRENYNDLEAGGDIEAFSHSRFGDASRPRAARRGWSFICSIEPARREP